MSSRTGSAPSRGTGARLDRALESLRERGRIGIMAHMIYGYPSPGESEAIASALVRAGADLVEVQVPFSDPTADGPVITEACQRALDAGARVAGAFGFLETATRRHDVPFLVMTYLNVAFAYRRAGGAGGSGVAGGPSEGLRAFVEDAARAGAAGIIIPDLPPEQRQEGYVEACRDSGVHPIWVISPNISDRRLGLIRDVASGLVYSTSRTGTTGKEMALELEGLRRFLARAREALRLPLAVGFSISKREHVEALAGHAEVAVVGTHLLRAFDAGRIQGLEEELRRLGG